MQTLYIMQGIPGSGKSTIAKQLAPVVCSTDDFFMQGYNYVFQPEKLGEFHQKNLELTKIILDRGVSVVVDNTNIHCWECREYVKYAISKVIPVVFIRVIGNFKSIHGVPEEKIAKMKEEIEDLTVEKVLNSKCPWE